LHIFEDFGERPTMMAESRSHEPPIPAASSVIRLLATESSAAIMTVLGEGPLRSAQLKDRLAQYSPRTVYRRVDELVRLGAVVQRTFATSPPAVVYELTVPTGRELLSVLEEIAAVWLRGCHGGPTEGQRWGLLALLADGWDSAIVRELTYQPRSLSELGVVSDMTYHQLARRVTRLAAAGLLERVPNARVTRYALSEQTRRGATVIAAAAYWERRNLPPPRPLSASETGALLRAALPRVTLPDHAGAVFAVTVEAPRKESQDEKDVQRFDSLRVEVDEGGSIRCIERGERPPDAWARGSIDAWLSVLVEGEARSLQVGGDREIVDAHFLRLHAETAPVTWSTR
jgi:DNA-binding HxlR family transcriptional regulator